MARNYGAPFKTGKAARAAANIGKAARAAANIEKGDASAAVDEENVNDLLAYLSPKNDANREAHEAKKREWLDSTRPEQERKARLSKGSGKAGPNEY